MSQMESMKCAVCDLTTNGINRGVPSCRACANFFKRTHSLRKYYVCRTGTGDCDVRRDLPFLCRRCRFDKCINVGMKIRDKERKKWASVKEEDKCSNSSSPEGSVLTDGILARAIREFDASFERRKQLELDLWKNNFYGEERVAAPDGEIFFLATGEFTEDHFPPTVDDMRKMYILAFDEFAALSERDQASDGNLVMTSCAGSSYIIERNKLANKHFPGSHRYTFISATSVLDNESCSSFFPGINPVGPMEELIRTMEFYNEKSESISRQAIRDADLTETEYNAAVCLLTWSFDFSPCIEQKIVDLGASIKKKVFTELNWYYKNELKCTDVASRLGTLMMCVHAAQEAGVLMQEEFQMYKLMEAVSEDSLLFKFYT